MKKTIEEKLVDQTKLWFHGSSESRVSKFDPPSFLHPFYVSADLHYAMAFCTKTGSSTGDYEQQKTYTSSDKNYVYVVTIDPKCNVFDFRDHSTSEFKKLFKIIDKDVYDWLQSFTSKKDGTIDFQDIYEFCIALQCYLMQRIDISNANYLEYCKKFPNDKDLVEMTPRTFLKACKFVKTNNLFGKYNSFDIHQVMAEILKALGKIKFHGVLTREHDFNDEHSNSTGSVQVTTNNAIGIFDKAGLDLLSIVPMKYSWLKKINSTYLKDKTSDSAYEKVKTFIQKYKRFVQRQIQKKQNNKKQLSENKQTYLKKNALEPDVKSVVDKFWQIKSRLRTPQNDIDWWMKKPFAELKSFVFNFDIRNKAERRQDSYRQTAEENGANLLGVESGYEIWYVPTYDAMQALGRFYKGRSARWCVASDDPDFWFDNHENDEFVVLIRQIPKGNEFDKIAIQFEDGGRYFEKQKIIPWDLENNDRTFDDWALIHTAWILFKDAGQTRENY